MLKLLEPWLVADSDPECRQTGRVPKVNSFILKQKAVKAAKRTQKRVKQTDCGIESNNDVKIDTNRIMRLGLMREESSAVTGPGGM